MEEQQGQKHPSIKSEGVIISSFAFWFAVLVAIDQLAKFWARNIFKNQFFAFSLRLPTGVMYFVFAVILVMIFYHVAKNYGQFSTAQTFAWLLILAGGISNIAERLALGYVRDYIYIFTGILNLADLYIILGIIILLIRNNQKSI